MFFIIYEFSGCSFYGLLLPPPGLLHHCAIILVLFPLLSHIVPKVLIFPLLSRQIDKSWKLTSLACVLLGLTPIHLTAGFYRTTRQEQLGGMNRTCPFWPNCNFIKTSKARICNDIQCILLEYKRCMLLFHHTFFHVVTQCCGILCLWQVILRRFKFYTSKVTDFSWNH